MRHTRPMEKHAVQRLWRGGERRTLKVERRRLKVEGIPRAERPSRAKRGGERRTLKVERRRLKAYPKRSVRHERSVEVSVAR